MLFDCGNQNFAAFLLFASMVTVCVVNAFMAGLCFVGHKIWPVCITADIHR